MLAGPPSFTSLPTVSRLRACAQRAGGDSGQTRPGKAGLETLSTPLCSVHCGAWVAGRAQQLPGAEMEWYQPELVCRRGGRL